MKSTAKIPSEFACDRCNYSGRTKGALCAHKKVHAEKKLRCDFCDYKTQFRRNLTLHNRTHSGEKPFICEFSDCDYSSSQAPNLAQHVLLIHSDGKPFPCKACSESFKSKHHLNGHVIAKHKGKRPHQCLHRGCEYSSTKITDVKVKKHMFTHTGERPFRCYFNECDYASTERHNLTVHIRTHTGEKPNRCSFKDCEYSSARFVDMERHALTHSRQKPHRCNFEDCSFASARESSLKNHLLRHLIRNELFSAKTSDERTKHSQHETTTECEFNSSKRKIVALETAKSQNNSCNNNYSLTVLQRIEIVTMQDLPKHKQLKEKHHFNFNSHTELQHASKKSTQIQPGLQLEPLTSNTYLNHNASTKNSLFNLAGVKTEDESSVEPSTGILPTSAPPNLEKIDCKHFGLQVKVEQCKKYSCPICDFGTKKKSKYKDHVELHQKEGHLFSPPCDFASLSSEHFNKHLLIHPNDSCDDANKSIIHKSNCSPMSQGTLSDTSSLILNSHSVPRPGDQEAVDESAAAVKPSKHGGKLQVLKNHENGIKNLDGNKIHHCSICEYKTNKASHLTRHIRAHAEDHRFSCTFSGCNYSSANKGNLIRHLVLKHSDEKPFYCQLCGERFRNKQFLNSHVRNHKGKRPICCQYKGCEYSCTSPSNLKGHMRTHTLEKPYHCYFEGCDFSCSWGNVLQVHIRTHTGERPYHCTFKNCYYSAAKSCTLRTHLLTHTKDKPFRCDFNGCKFSSAQSIHLKLHMIIHITQTPHACQKCKFRYRTPLELEQHLETDHKLQNTSDSRHLQPNVPIRESPAESVTNILSAQVQSSFSFKNNNERDSEAREEAGPNKKYSCTVCSLESKSHKKYKAHLDSYGQKNKNTTPEVSVTSNVVVCNENSSQTQKTVQMAKKSAKAAELPTSATKTDLREPKKVKTKHRFNNHVGFLQMSSSSTQTQPSIQLQPPVIKPGLKSRRTRKLNLAKAGLERGEESSAAFKAIEAISPTHVQPCEEAKNSQFSQSQSVLQLSPVKLKPWKKHSCPICEFGTKKKRKYKDHIELHQKEGYLFCSICDFASLNRKRFKKHLCTHENGPCDDNNSIIQKSSCSKVPLMSHDILSDNSSSLLNSHSLHHGDKVTANGSATAVQLPEHGVKVLMPMFKENDIKSSEEKKMHYCSNCNYKTNRTSHLARHDRVHTGERPYSCTYSGCNFSSARKQVLVRHSLLRHSNEKAYSCKLCGERFQNKNLLNMHVPNHQGRKPFMCLYTGCEFSSTFSSALKRHLRTHTLEKPHLCYFEGCDFSCSREDTLKVHIRTHTGERPYHCTFKNCNFSGRTSGSLTTHLLSHTNVKPFDCDFNDCKFSTARSGILKVHMLRHLTQNPHSCPNCKFRSRTPLEIEQHLETHHTLQNASPISGQFQPPIRESLAESVTNILRVQAQPCFSSQNSNERFSETVDQARPSQNYICARCGFESKSKKTQKAHLESHVEKRQLLKTRETKLTKHKTSLKEGGDIFSTRSQAKENSTVVLRESKKSLAPFSCNFCKKSFAKEMNLLNHLRYHTGQKMPGL